MGSKEPKGLGFGDGETKKSGKAETKIGLERYLQTSPQSRGVCALLRSKYASEAKLSADWDSIAVQILERKTK